MPLFFIISGYLFERKLTKPIAETSAKLFRRLIIPNLLWGIMLTLVAAIGFNRPIAVTGVFNAFWFLYTLFVLSITYLIAYRICKRTIITTIILTFIVLLLPGCEFIKFSFPFFGLGLILGSVNFISKQFCIKFLILGGLIILCAYFTLWRGDEYIYLSPSPSITDLISFNGWREWILRIIFGSSFSILIILFLVKIKKPHHYISSTLGEFSRHSLGIYVTHLFLLTVLSLILGQTITHIHYAITLSVSFLIAAIAIIGISKLVSIVSDTPALRYLY